MKLIRAFFYEGNRFSVTRFWKSVAYCLVTYIVWQMGKDVSWEVLALYLAIIAADNRAGALLKAKFKSEETAAPGSYGYNYHRGPYGPRLPEVDGRPPGSAKTTDLE